MTWAVKEHMDSILDIDQNQVSNTCLVCNVVKKQVVFIAAKFLNDHLFIFLFQ